MRRIFLVSLLFVCTTASARDIAGEVSHVTDGDTVWLRTGAGRLQVRLHGIDAPEICQPGGREAQSALAARILHRRVVLQPQARDSFDRTVGRLRLGRDDLGAWMVREGWAWSHRWRGRAGPYDALELRARRERAGLWRAAQPESPREFRRRHGACPH